MHKRYIVALFLTVTIIFTICNQSLADANSFQSGMTEYKKKQYEKAIEHYNAVLKDVPEHVEAPYYLGMCYFQLKNYEEAVKAFLVETENAPEKGETYYFLGVSFLNLDKVGKGIKMLKKADEKMPGNYDVKYYLGYAYYKDKEYKDALVLLTEVMEKVPAYKLSAAYYIALCHYESGDFESAKTSFNTVTKMNPQSNFAIDAKNYLQKMATPAAQSQKDWALLAKVTVTYDDNVLLEPDDSTTPASDKSDYKISFYGLGYTNIAGDLNASYVFYQSLYSDLSEYNIQGHFANLFFDTATKPVKYRLGITGQFFTLDKHNYLGEYGPFIKVGIEEGSRALTDIRYRYFVRDYIHNMDRDASNHSIRLLQYYFLNERKDYLNIGVEFESNNTKLSEYNYTERKFVANALFGVSKELKLKLTGELYVKDFSDSPAGGDDRSDDNIDLIAGIEYYTSEKSHVEATYRYSKNDSNDDYYDYSRNQYLLSYAIEF